MALRIVLLLWLGSAGSPMTTSSRAPNAASPSVKAPTETNRSLELPRGGIRAAGALPVSTDPSPVTALLGSDVLLTCSFPVAPRGAGEGDGQLRVTWYFQGQALMELDGIAVTTRKGAELFAPELPRGNASLLLPHVTLAEQGPYRCSVRYGGQRGEGTVRLRVAALPRVEVPSPVVQREEDSALVCCVRGFYPQDVAVSWLRDGQELNTSFVSAARRGHRDETFSLVSVYSFTPTEQDLGALFSCRARHPALNQSRQANFRITFRGAGRGTPACSGPHGTLQGLAGEPRPAQGPIVPSNPPKHKPTSALLELDLPPQPVPPLYPPSPEGQILPLPLHWGLFPQRLLRGPPGLLLTLLLGRGAQSHPQTLESRGSSRSPFCSTLPASIGPGPSPLELSFSWASPPPGAARGPEEQRGLLEPGLRILLWMLRGALLLAMALGGWSCYCSGRRHGQVREWIWTPDAGDHRGAQPEEAAEGQAGPSLLSG
ncbi:unnamed protein product [Lepidochelys kempii]